MSKGWASIHRKFVDSDFWLSEPFTKPQAWVDLFTHANHKKGFISIRGNNIVVERGQLAWSEITMTKRWKWSRNKVRRFLSYLEQEGQIIRNTSDWVQNRNTSETSDKNDSKTPKNDTAGDKTNRYITTVITVVNYDFYQRNDTADDTAERQQKDSRRYINNKNNNVNNKYSSVCSTYVSEFNNLFKRDFRETGGRERKLKARLKNYTMDQILEALRNMSEDKFYSGGNDRGWVADPDFLILSDEQVDKFLNLKSKKKGSNL